MKNIKEAYRDPIRLTSNQKAILATLAQADGGMVADDVLASSPNLSGALKQMVKLRMVANEQDDQYIITDIGKEYAVEANIIDDSGELTEEGGGLVIGAEATPAVTESVGSFKDYLILT